MLIKRILAALTASVTAAVMLSPAALAAKETDPKRLDRLRNAIKDIDLCFMGTIHSFCVRILSEHPNEAKLPIGAHQ